MFHKKAKSKINAYGVAKITRHSYSTNSGFTAVNSWWELRKKAFDRDGGYCVPCKSKKRLCKATDVHHIVALSRGGTNTLGNLISVCVNCHDARHNHMKRAGR